MQIFFYLTSEIPPITIAGMTTSEGPIKAPLPHTGKLCNECFTIYPTFRKAGNCHCGSGGVVEWDDPVQWASINDELEPFDPFVKSDGCRRSHDGNHDIF